MAVFEMNAEAFPASPNVYDSLGEGYVHLFDRENAISSYMRVLELDPENENARWSMSIVDQTIVDLRNETSMRSRYGPGENTGLQGDYLGQKPPGLTGELFAEGGWSAPEEVPDMPGAFEPHITHDGKRMFFGRGSEIWFMERSADGWSDSVRHGPGMFATTTSEGTLYVTDISDPWNPSITRQDLVDGAYAEPEKISETMNGPTSARIPASPGTKATCYLIPGLWMTSLATPTSTSASVSGPAPGVGRSSSVTRSTLTERTFACRSPLTASTSSTPTGGMSTG
ncbi:tetratricopeptide repeat protein [Candidatus Eisenbacteria bacterium]|uniref:Tetratricopeptide repeat protein n=1 Tax=Eiseniibacteriota bacterium TaxID=2212470 RepID=A0ABV6YLQ6_UNCEI